MSYVSRDYYTGIISSVDSYSASLEIKVPLKEFEFLADENGNTLSFPDPRYTESLDPLLYNLPLDLLVSKFEPTKSEHLKIGSITGVINGLDYYSTEWRLGDAQFLKITPTPTVTNTPTLTQTVTPTKTSSSTPTPTISVTSTSTPTATPTPTRSLSPTPSTTPSTTITPTTSLSLSPTHTQTATISITPTISLTPTPSITTTPTSTPTSSISATPTSTPTISLTPTISTTPSITLSQTRTPTASSSPGASQTPTVSITPTATKTPSHTPTVSLTPTISLSPTNTITPSNSITPTISISPTTSITATPSVTPSLTLTPTATPTISVSPTLTRTPSPTPTATSTKTPTPTATPTQTSTPTKTATPTVTLSATPTPTPTQFTKAKTSKTWLQFGNTYFSAGAPAPNYFPIQNNQKTFSLQRRVTSNIYSLQSNRYYKPSADQFSSVGESYAPGGDYSTYFGNYWNVPYWSHPMGMLYSNKQVKQCINSKLQAEEFGIEFWMVAYQMQNSSDEYLIYSTNNSNITQSKYGGMSIGFKTYNGTNLYPFIEYDAFGEIIRLDGSNSSSVKSVPVWNWTKIRLYKTNEMKGDLEVMRWKLWIGNELCIDHTDTTYKTFNQEQGSNNFIKIAGENKGGSRRFSGYLYDFKVYNI